jgi:hypothetical protein
VLMDMERKKSTVLETRWRKAEENGGLWRTYRTIIKSRISIL